MAEDDLIMRMAKAFHAAFPVPHGVLPKYKVQWEDLTQETRDNAYDSMWQALKLLREPTEDMLAGVVDLAGSRDNGVVTFSECFTAMIDKLLEVK